MITISHHWRCLKCGAEVVHKFPYYDRDSVAIPYPPEGWTVIEKQPYCEKHVVTIRVTDRVTDI